YSAASLSERLYAWPEGDGRPAAAGLLICTTASDSDGTLGGLVQLSEPARLQRVVAAALERATRCSSDQSARCGPRKTRRTSCTARPATAASWPRKLPANEPTGSSTGGSWSTCRAATSGSSDMSIDPAAAR